MRIAIIGGGSMGQALGRSLLEKGLLVPADLLIVESDLSKTVALKNDLNCSVDLVPENIGSYQYVILAVKPQDFPNAAKGIGAHLLPQQAIISIMAGVSVKTISEALNMHAVIVRCMPNLPASISKGVTGYFVPVDCDPGVIEEVESILGSMGAVVRISEEKKLNAVTAVSGSGPAYLFYFIEAALEACGKLGLNEDTARTLVEKTVAGSLELWAGSKFSASELRAMVTSKGGTTEAAIKVFEEGSLDKVLISAIQKAAKRAEELGS